MISPKRRETILILFVIVMIICGFTLFNYNHDTKKTRKKIIAIQQLLEKEKEVFHNYPEELKTIIRNNPLRKDLLKDAWNNDFRYQQLVNGKSYTIISLGKDGILNTEDDIK